MIKKYSKRREDQKRGVYGKIINLGGHSINNKKRQYKRQQTQKTDKK